MKHRWLTSAAIVAASVALPLGVVSAQDDGATGEAYPPSGTGGIVDPGAGGVVDPGDPGRLPATGNDGTDTWLRLGAGAVLVGGILVTAAARRRHVASPVSG